MTPDANKQILAEGRFLRLVKHGRWEWAERTNTRAAAVIVPLTAAGEIVFVEQFRIPLGRRVIELPAGLVGDQPGSEHEELVDAARRELLEETGFAAEHMEYVLTGPSSAGMTSEEYSLVLATGLTRVSAGGGDASEDIQVHVVPLADAEVWLAARRKSGIAVDPRAYVGLYFAGKHPVDC